MESCSRWLKGMDSAFPIHASKQAQRQNVTVTGICTTVISSAVYSTKGNKDLINFGQANNIVFSEDRGSNGGKLLFWVYSLAVWKMEFVTLNVAEGNDFVLELM